ncbi:monooxygenase FAD-binding protein [[Leptolyngbya] sp. PCC 7376]|uniref:FAD-dependent monooxygenase n=1 Tax=[Leptolyngbya] sp. PCC 7376 TaxID=111781 RepID=UPI00029EC4A7|nr:FAD-dependent monooxygenase [[Leptolyngbya] sp. PCC 7376]AFY37548.1 monooxygenase FAD-binding protein [[Leptolyngbya] sp. PCC 7376]
MASPIGIVGAGIGGLTLACTLEQSNIPFQLYEQSESFEALGYGIQVSPNVVRILSALGLAEELEKMAHRCHGFELRSFYSDQTLIQWQLPKNQLYYQCRRADLHQLLFDGLQDKSKLNFSTHLSSYARASDSISLQFDCATDANVSALVGADGVGSQTRKQLMLDSQNTKPSYAGYAAFRAILPWRSPYAELAGKATVWLGKNHHVVAYPNGNLTSEHGQQWLNLVLVVKEKQWQEEGWAIAANKQEVAAEFSNQSKLLNQILVDMIDSPEPCYKWGLFERSPLPFWSQGRVTLLGDAAHPMLPFQAQGAAMSIEDAYILAQCLQRHSEIETAFRQYEKMRYHRATQMQKTSRKNADIFHASGLKAIARDFVFRVADLVAPDLMNLKSAWIYDYDATRL